MIAASDVSLSFGAQVFAVAQFGKVWDVYETRDEAVRALSTNTG